MPDIHKPLRIALLADVPECLSKLAAMFVTEWEPYYGPEGEGDANLDLAACCNRNELPVALVALDADGEVAGTAALKADSVGSEPEEAPWLAALVVAENRKREGIGAMLIEAVEDLARRLGYDVLFTSAEPENSLSAAGEWVALRQVPSLRGSITVYRRRLDGR